MRNGDKTPTPMSSLGSLAVTSVAAMLVAGVAAMSIAAMSVAAALMIAPGIAVAAGAELPRVAGRRLRNLRRRNRRNRTSRRTEAVRLKISSPATKPLTLLSTRKASTKRRSRRCALSITTTMPTWRT